MAKRKGQNKKKKKDNDLMIKTPIKGKSLSNEDIENSTPVFCFKYLQDNSIDKCKDAAFFINFLHRLRMLSDVTWKQIEISSRHGVGMEKMLISDLKPDKPQCLTPDVAALVVFRAVGNNLPFLGFRQREVFHVVYIESAFGDIYEHE